MKIVAFLQNPWFRPGTDQRLIDLYRTNQEFHRRVLRLSATGKALYNAFGPKLYSEIHWDNANPRSGSTRDTKYPPDMVHMENVIVAQNPDVLLLFGRQAQDGIDRILHESFLKYTFGYVVFRAPHPMARGSAVRHLEQIVRDLRSFLAQKKC